jgi:hypothetical protein
MSEIASLPDWSSGHGSPFARMASHRKVRPAQKPFGYQLPDVMGGEADWENAATTRPARRASDSTNS